MRFVVPVLWSLYAAFFATLAYVAINDDTSLAYPALFTWTAAASYSCVTFGVLAHAFNWRPPSLRATWRTLFPLLVAVPAIGLAMDAVLPPDYSLSTAGFAWLMNTAFVVLLVAPGYVANWKLAYSSS
jgi:hypothetical protein